ncbi:MAG: hypothetical protein LBI95_00990 [Holosporales bacterium]|jgi:hypothetical protein|nr:hypothetical protein [Holosporales bacterium]
MNPVVIFAVFAMSISQLSAKESTLFNVKRSQYISHAKAISKKQMTDEEVSALTEEAASIIDDMKNQYIFDALKTDEIVLKYLNGKDFPDSSEPTVIDPNDQKIVGFTIACYWLCKNLSKDLISKIVQKSPLEMVSIIQELSVFFKFISADPNDFGHGTFREKNETATTIFSTNEAILRIMKPLICKNLLKDCVIYKLSRLGTTIVNDNNFNLTAIIDSLKRNTADDSRIPIYIVSEGEK